MSEIEVIELSVPKSLDLSKLKKKDEEVQRIPLPRRRRREEPPAEEEEPQEEEQPQDDEGEEENQDEGEEIPEEFIQEEDPTERRNLILILKRYRSAKYNSQHLKPIENELTDDSLDSKTNKQLQNLIEECRILIRSKVNLVTELFNVVSAFGEQALANFEFIKPNGWARYMANNEEIQSVLEECSIERLSLSYVSPEKRLLIGMLQSLRIVHGINQAQEQIQNSKQTLEKKLNEEAPKNLQEKYKDL